MSIDYSASVLLAMEHANAQDSSVVAELEECSYHFERPPVIKDSRRDKNQAFDALLEAKSDQLEICAIVGPFLEESIESTSQLAYTFQVPQFLFSMTDYRTTLSQLGPNAIGNSYSDQVLAQDIVSYIEFLQRDYIAVVHFPNNAKDRLAYQIVQQASKVHLTSRSYELGPAPPPFDKAFQYPELFRKVKATGFRTLVMLYHRADHLVQMAEAMEKAGVLDGDFVIFLLEQAAPPEALNLVFQDAPSDHPVWKLLNGSFVIRGLDGFVWNTNDPFLKSWRSLDSEFASRVEAILPYNVTVPPDYFQTSDPYVRSSFVYDSVVSIAVSACQMEISDAAAEARYIPTINAIRNMAFEGASGNVSIHAHSKLRERQHTDAGVYNIRVATIGELEASLVALRLSGMDFRWEAKGVATYADGTSTKPAPLLVISKENFLSPSARALGLSLFATCWAISILFSLAIYFHREHPIIKSGQPFFLQLVLLGSCITSASTLTLSFDELSGWSKHNLSIACASSPWLFFLGLILSYAGLFCKVRLRFNLETQNLTSRCQMWRVDRVLSMSRRIVEPMHVLGPLVALLAIAVVLLTTWTVHDPWTWKRGLVRLDPPESFGECSSDHFVVYFALLVVVTVIASGLATLWALKVRKP